jgi:colanic acid biosynthesis glycosyl transferase WcaI
LKSIVFTEQFYFPDGWGGVQLPRDVTTYLARSGLRVEVICGGDQYVAVGRDDGLENPCAAGVIVRRTPRIIGGPIRRWKAIKQLFYCFACAPLLLIRRTPDVFVTQTNPPMIVLLTAVAAAIHRCPFVIIAQDVYPEILFAHGISRADAFAGRMLERVFRWAYRRACKVVALGEVMAGSLVRKGVEASRIVVISNWATGNESVERQERGGLREEWGLLGSFVVLYSGNIGIAHDIETPIEALRILLPQSPNARLLFIGGGSRLAETRRLVAGAGVSGAVQFRPFLPPDQLPRSFGIAQLALVTLRQGFEGLVVPSKLLGYMARGIPTLYVGPYSDVEQILIESGGGLCFRNGAAEELARGVQSLIAQPDRLQAMGTAAERYYQANLASRYGLSKYASLIRGIVDGSSA